MEEFLTERLIEEGMVLIKDLMKDAEDILKNKELEELNEEERMIVVLTMAIEEIINS